MGTVSEPVPVTGLAENFSPIPRIAPPPLGRESLGAFRPKPSLCPCSSCPCTSLSLVIPIATSIYPQTDRKGDESYTELAFVTRKNSSSSKSHIKPKERPHARFYRAGGAQGARPKCHRKL